MKSVLKSISALFAALALTFATFYLMMGIVYETFHSNQWPELAKVVVITTPIFFGLLTFMVSEISKSEGGKP